ncbi:MULTISPECIES: 4Fe-4S dicluster domain-containing protein [unclassified Caldicellulosiruptor]|uniref:4Fe-4S dicluster domain-containing protein n=1 Tax=unclassified Caldicellulosiruptor TaxID=2622462 RepID=UPI0003AA7079|nr:MULTISPECIES: 4Fe-4S dicluster domain-containing protein [unclassified Caldicellulosiruptor]
MKRIYIEPTTCTGCMNCILACIAHHKGVQSVLEIDFSDNDLEFANNIVLNNEGKIVPIFCRHCDQPECVAACMSGALTKDETTGYVICNQSWCAGCFMCVMSCPYGMIKPNKSGDVAIKCDMCLDREIPACVQSCPVQAISLIDVD